MVTSTGKKNASTFVAIILALIPLLMVLGNSVLIPGLPDMQQKMHVTKFQISLIITLFSVPAGIVIPVAGFLSDRIGRKWIVIPSLLLFGAGGIVAGCASWFLKQPYWIILVGRVLQGIGASGTAPIAMAWVGDLFKGSSRSRALGINEAGNAFGKVVSPVLGAVIAAWIWYGVFFIFPILCVPLAAAVLWMIPKEEKAQPQSVKQYLSSLGGVLKQEGRWLAVAYLCGAAALFNLFGVLFYLSDLLENKYHIDGVPKGWVLAIPLAVLTVTSLVIGSVIKKRKVLMKWLIVTGFGILACCLLAGTWVSDRAFLLVTFMGLGAVGTGMILPCLNTFITSAVSSEKRGIVTSFYGSVRFLGVAFGPPVYTWLLDISNEAMFISVAALAAVCGGLVVWLVKPEPAPANDIRPMPVETKPSGRSKARI